MKSPEQIDNQGEKPVENTEQKLTLEELTRQRRKEYGLEESNELTSEKATETETAIEDLLERLNGEHDYDNASPETQEEWYWVEQEAIAGKDRELAKAVLEQFLKTLEKE